MLVIGYRFLVVVLPYEPRLVLLVLLYVVVDTLVLEVLSVMVLDALDVYHRDKEHYEDIVQDVIDLFVAIETKMVRTNPVVRHW